MNRRLSLTALILLLAYLSEAQGSCWRFGHRCWGGHGKRSGSPTVVKSTLPVQSSVLENQSSEQDIFDDSYSPNLPSSSSQEFQDSPSDDLEYITVSEPETNIQNRRWRPLSTVLRPVMKKAHQANVPAIRKETVVVAEQDVSKGNRLMAPGASNVEAEQTNQFLDYSSGLIRDGEAPATVILFRVPRINEKKAGDITSHSDTKGANRIRRRH